MSEAVDKYLTQVLAFKAKKELHADYLDEEEREKLLKELTLSLGFSQRTWEEAKEQSQFHYSIFKQLKDDYSLGLSISGQYKALLNSSLLKAISLDPFNEKYLHTHVISHHRDWKPKKELSIRYLMLQKPGTTEFVDTQVDLAIRPDELDYDYFDADIVGPYIDNLIFLEENHPAETGSLTSADLKEMAKSAGIDKATLKELEKEVDDMREIVEKTMDNHWMTWADIHKASLVVDRMVELAPFRPSILFCAIQFYGKAKWTAFLAPAEVKSKNKEDRKAFHMLIFNKLRPNASLRIQEAEKSMAKAKALAKAFDELPTKLFEKEDNNGSSAIELEIRRLKFKFRQQVNPQSVKSFIRSQELLLEAHKTKALFQRSNNIFALILGIIFSVVFGALMYSWVGEWEALINFSVIPVMAAMGVANVRRVWWVKRRK